MFENPILEQERLEMLMLVKKYTIQFELVDAELSESNKLIYRYNKTYNGNEYVGATFQIETSYYEPTQFTASINTKMYVKSDVLLCSSELCIVSGLNNIKHHRKETTDFKELFEWMLSYYKCI